MKLTILKTVFAASVLIGASNYALAAKSTPTANTSMVLKNTSNATYSCNDGSTVKARYYNNPDLSVATVKIDGSSYTLPRVVSAIGTRYTDLNQIEWWTKGSEATLTKNVFDTSTTKTPSIECKEVAATKSAATKTVKKAKASTSTKSS